MTNSDTLRSAWYVGRVRHRRREVKRHEFSYRTAMLFVDLDELDELDRTSLLSVNRWGLMRWDRRDYLGESSEDLKEAVRSRAAADLGRRPTGRVAMLTLVRMFGYVFNPVSFYYLYDERDELDAIVAEITNTPWKERHAYVLDAKASDSPGEVRRTFAKDFHVSPFFEMDHTYTWRFGEPGDELWVHMENTRADQSLFDASLVLKRHAVSSGMNWKAAFLYPAMPAVSVVAIYWQALRLWLKRVPFFAHPQRSH